MIIIIDPFNWNVADVRNWLIWTQRQFNLQPFPLEYFAMDGMTLCSLNESDFKQRAPHCGEILYAQLDIWKTGMFWSKLYFWQKKELFFRKLCKCSSFGCFLFAYISCLLFSRRVSPRG